MDLIQTDLGFHISSQGLAITEPGHHTFLNLCFRSLTGPQIQTHKKCTSVMYYVSTLGLWHSITAVQKD